MVQPPITAYTLLSSSPTSFLPTSPIPCFYLLSSKMTLMSFKSFNITKSTTNLDVPVPVPVLKPLLLSSPDERRDMEEENSNRWLSRFAAAPSEQTCIALMRRAFNSAEEWCSLRGGSHRRVERDIKWDMVCSPTCTI